jgi:type I pantothenate kinase
MASAVPDRPSSSSDRDVSPYVELDRSAWAALGAATEQPLTRGEVEAVRGLGDELDLHEVEQVYLPLSGLLSLYVESAGSLHRAQEAFLDQAQPPRTPFVIGVAGSVAVGKSTTARILAELLSRWPSSPKVDLVTTDGFLHPNAVLKRENMMDRKGFPESYDMGSLLRFLSAIKAGQPNVKAPTYSHLTYDVLPDQFQVIHRPDILIFEGINVLQSRSLPADGKVVPMVSDFFDFSIYIDADEALIHNWYVERFMRLRETAFKNPDSYFNRYSLVSEKEALSIAEGLWRNTNLKNLRQNILPSRPRADLILQKGENHLVETVGLRKI